MSPPAIRPARVRVRALASLLALAAGCGREVEEVNAFASPCGALAVGDSVYASAEAHGSGGFPGSGLYDSNTRPGAFRWRSSDPAVAEVSGDGLLRARAPGRATLTATSAGHDGSDVVEVVRPAAAVSVAPTSAVLRPGDTAVFRLRVTGAPPPGGIPQPLFWARGDARVGSAAGVPPAALPPDGGGSFAAEAPGARTVQWCAAGRHGTVAVTVR